MEASAEAHSWENTGSQEIHQEEMQSQSCLPVHFQLPEPHTSSEYNPATSPGVTLHSWDATNKGDPKKMEKDIGAWK